MKKRPYRAVDVKHADVEKLIEVLRGDRVVIGVDVAKEDFVASVMDGEQTVLLTLKWKHPGETGLFLEFVKRVRGAVKVDVGMEPSGTYGDTLHALLCQNGLTVYQVSPKRVHDAAEVYDGVPSWHDAKSAAIIAKLHWDKQSRVWSEASTEDRDFRAATKTMAHYQLKQQENINQIEAELARYWPELGAIIGLGSATMLALLEEFGEPREVSARAEAAAELMGKVGGNLLLPEKIARVIESARHTVGVAATSGERRMLRDLARDTEITRQMARTAQALVERLSEKDPEAQRLGAVVGKATAAVIIAEVGRPSTFASAAGFEKSFGLNLKERSSGKKKGQLGITKRGSSRARRYLYMGSLRLLQTDKLVQEWHRQKTQRDGGIKMRSVIAIMRKYSRALWHVGRGSAFDSSKLFDARRLQQQQAA